MLPKKIYIWEEADSKGTSYFIAQKKPPDSDGEKVGIYILKETKTVKVDVKLE